MSSARNKAMSRCLLRTHVRWPGLKYEYSDMLPHGNKYGGGQSRQARGHRRPAKPRKHYGIKEGSLVTAEPGAEGVLIRPAIVVPVE